jgi:hypothetical protein
MAIAVACPVIALTGLCWLCFAMIDRKPKLPPIVSTIIGVMPGIVLLILVHLSR